MLYTRLPSDEELEASGFCRADYEEEVEIWPENWPAFELFGLMDTQWNVGMSGPTGLNYPVLFQLMDRQGLDGDDWWGMLQDIRQMEAAALVAMQTKV